MLLIVILGSPKQAQQALSVHKKSRRTVIRAGSGKPTHDSRMQRRILWFDAARSSQNRGSCGVAARSIVHVNAGKRYPARIECLAEDALIKLVSRWLAILSLQLPMTSSDAP